MQKTCETLGFAGEFRYASKMPESLDKTAMDRRYAERCRARRDLLAAIGLDPQSLPVRERAAIEALAGEVLSLREDRARLKQELETAAHLADRDALCPIFNRRAFERELAREISLAERYGTPLCMLFIDLDRFKLINDRFGHATGDTVIKHVAETLVENLRQSDIVGRLGGDEFGIAFTHAELSDAKTKAAKLESLIGAIVVRDAENNGLESVHLGASCGVAEWRRGRNAASLIAEADETMFRRKNEKKRAREGAGTQDRF
ncbi:MAG: GGDEF domain-containing protein [Alphaproteobacteria bacterium]|nr:GGDEF domain-containing protein [Alphaproteobacteria bacterium]